MIDHGFPVDFALRRLGVTEHTDEDCRVSSVVASALGAFGAIAVIAQGRNVWVGYGDEDGNPHHIVRSEISAGDRRRILIGKAGLYALKPPSTPNPAPWAS